MASPIESPTWEREVLCGCKGCAVARKPLQDAIERVRELHRNIDGYCSGCDTPTEYPCETIEALDGEK